MEYQDAKKIEYAHGLAKKFEFLFKKCVADTFSNDHETIQPSDLSILLGDKDGVYLSEEEADTLCCLVVGQKNGFLYLVTAKIGEAGNSLNDFKSFIVS